MTELRRVQLRDEQTGRDRRALCAHVDEAGRLHVDGQDLGPGTALVSDDGEHEWFQTIAAADVPSLVEVLGGGPDDDVIDLLAERFTGEQSYEFERRLRASAIPVELFVV